MRALLKNLFSQPSLDEVNGRVTEVIDGDSFVMKSDDGETIKARLWGIDAPEGRQTCHLGRRKWRCGNAAQESLARKLFDKDVRCEIHDTDQHGRLVVECFLEDGTSINALQVRQGWAFAFKEFTKKFVPEENKARREKLKLWKCTDLEKPQEWRERHG